jgi:peptidyl-prolyl cis-trans isomerase C
MDTLNPEQSLALMRRAAMNAGLLAADDPEPVDGVVSAAAAEAIEALVERLPQPAAPDEASCRRWYAANESQFARGERVRLRHVLFGVTPGVNVDALRAKAESCLLELRARGRDEAAEGERFAAAAREWSNCPSGADGGALGWLAAADCAAEFAREVFGHAEVGVLPRLVASRFGLHVVEVLEREAGEVPPYEAVHEAVQGQLVQQAWANGVRAYVQGLAAELETG